MNPFETETMAELCLRQGHRAEAAGIYRRLIARASDETARARLSARLGTLDGAPGAVVTTLGPGLPGEAGLSSPGLRTRSVGDRLHVDWRLPPGVRTLTLQLLLVLRGPAGVATETRTLPLESEAGRLVLDVPGLHSAKAAAGVHKDGRFVPVLRT
jgi:hypothetical protein